MPSIVITYLLCNLESKLITRLAVDYLPTPVTFNFRHTCPLESNEASQVRIMRLNKRRYCIYNLYTWCSYIRVSTDLTLIKTILLMLIKKKKTTSSLFIAENGILKVVCCRSVRCIYHCIFHERHIGFVHWWKCRGSSWQWVFGNNTHFGLWSFKWRCLGSG